jgi:excisionase family DNA binding protein
VDASQPVVTGKTPRADHGLYSPLSRLLTVRELADLLQVPPKTIYTWRYKRMGPPAVRIGRYLRFRAEDITAWLQTRADVSTAPHGHAAPLQKLAPGGGGRTNPG